MMNRKPLSELPDLINVNTNITEKSVIFGKFCRLGQSNNYVFKLKQEVKPDKSQYAEIVGEVKNKENINQELDYDDRSTGDQIILSNCALRYIFLQT